jgi:branched-chain amino acid transport system substrate-binding protein
MKYVTAAILSSSLLFAACGAANAQFTDDAIKIGVLTDMSGPFADVTGNGSVEAAKMAIEKLGGKIAGKPVEIIFADHQNKADIGASTARRWFDIEGVDVIVDSPNSAVALAVNEIARERGKAFLISGAASSDITSAKCSPTTVHWTYDTWALANTTANAIIKNGGMNWFFVTADYAFGHALQRDVTALVEAQGGKIIGSVNHPLNTSDFSSYLLQAQASDADIIGLANAGSDTANTIKQAAEFGVTSDGKQLAGLLITIPDIHAIGLDSAQGLLFAGAFYWNRTPETREFSEELAKRNNDIHPDMIQAGVYSSLLHYAKGLEKAGTDDGKAVVDAMKSIPTDDPLFGKGEVRADGRTTHPMYLFQVKSPDKSKEPWDYYNVISEIDGDQAFRPLEEGDCPLVN